MKAKGGAQLKKYNYFDDDAEYLDKRRARKDAQILAKQKVISALQGAADSAVEALKKLSKGKVKIKRISVSKIGKAFTTMGFRASVGILWRQPLC